MRAHNWLHVLTSEPKWNAAVPNYLHFLLLRPLNSASNKFIHKDSLFKKILKNLFYCCNFQMSRECPGPLKYCPNTFFWLFLTEVLCPRVFPLIFAPSCRCRVACSFLWIKFKSDTESKPNVKLIQKQSKDENTISIRH